MEEIFTKVNIVMCEIANKMKISLSLTVIVTAYTWYILQNLIWHLALLLKLRRRVKFLNDIEVFSLYVVYTKHIQTSISLSLSICLA